MQSSGSRSRTEVEQGFASIGGEGEMADLDDGPDQAPLPVEQAQETTARPLAETSYNLILP